MEYYLIYLEIPYEGVLDDEFELFSNEADAKTYFKELEGKYKDSYLYPVLKIVNLVK